MSTENPPEKPKGRPPEDAPPGYKGGIFDQIDVPSIASFTICLLLFVLILVWIRSVDYSGLEKTTLEDLSDRVSKIIMPLKPLDGSLTAPKTAKAPPVRSAARKSGDQTALARIERSRRTVGEQIGKVQERITKAAVLTILSGKGSGAVGKPAGRSGGQEGFAGFGDLDARLGNLDGLTKFDGNNGGSDPGGPGASGTKGDAIGATSGIDNMVQGFKNAKKSVLTKIGVAEAEAPELMERSAKFTGNRSPSEVAAFISRKQSMVSMLYEERLRINPALEGKITVVMVIEEDGTVSSASVMRSESTLDDPDFAAELIRRIRRWVFPPSTGGPVEMKSPFIFKPA